MSLSAWLEKGTLHQHHPSKNEIAGLLALADRNLADAGIKVLSAEGRFNCAYGAVLTAATIALHAAGFRTNSNLPGHHTITLQSLEYTLGADSALSNTLDAYRRKRNKISYDTPVAVAAKEAEDLLVLARQLRRDVEQWLRKKYPALI